MSDFDHMPNYREPERLQGVGVIHLSPEGILLSDARSGLFTVEYDAGACVFRLIAVPAWPEGAQEAIQKILSEVYDEEGVDLWFRSALVKGWTHEHALNVATALKEGNLS